MFGIISCTQQLVNYLHSFNHINNTSALPFEVHVQYYPNVHSASFILISADFCNSNLGAYMKYFQKYEICSMHD